MARPSPLPPTVRRRAGSARQNRLNTWWASAALNPTPWSRTATATAPSSPRTCTLTGRPSPCSMALVIRLRRMRRMRRGSTSARHGTGASSCSGVPYCWASRLCAASSSVAMVDRSTSSRFSSAAPASNRLISSRSVSSSSKRSSSADSSSVLRVASGSKSPRWPYRMSAAIRTVVSGVRSSWVTSETNCCCTCDRSSISVILRSSSVARWFIERASPARSSVPRTAIRSSR